MAVPHPIPYQGSKRRIADQILRFFPQRLDRLVEPFAGSAAVTIAAAGKRAAKRFLINDVNAPLMDLWDAIINRPGEIGSRYEELWREQLGDRKAFYYEIRDEFNRTHRPEHFLYLMARCVKGSIRYNSDGEFNQSADNRRKGKHPSRMKDDILAVSRLLKGKTEIRSEDYHCVLADVTTDDLVYMDPPYQGVCVGADPRYSETVEYASFVGQLGELASRGIYFIVSYDGRRGNQTYGKRIPPEVGVVRLELDAGRSTQSTLLGDDDRTYESLYLSVSLAEVLEPLRRPTQLELFSLESTL